MLAACRSMSASGPKLLVVEDDPDLPHLSPAYSKPVAMEFVHLLMAYRRLRKFAQTCRT